MYNAKGEGAKTSRNNGPNHTPLFSVDRVTMQALRYVNKHSLALRRPLQLLPHAQN